MQTEKSQPEGERIMPEMRFTEFPALSVDPGVGIFSSMIDYFSYLLFEKYTCNNSSIFIKVV